MYVPDESVIQTLAKISNCQVLNIRVIYLSDKLLKELPDGSWMVEQRRKVLQPSHLQILSASKYPLPCHGSYRRNTCILTLLDLPTILKQNKFIGIFIFNN